MSIYSNSPSRGGLSGRPDVRIKGRGDVTVVEVADDQGAWADVVDSLARRISQADGFFRDERLALAVGGRLITADDLQAVHEALRAQNIDLVAVHTGNSVSYQLARQLGLHAIWEADTPQPDLRSEEDFLSHSPNAGRLSRGAPAGQGGAPPNASPPAPEASRSAGRAQRAPLPPPAAERLEREQEEEEPTAMTPWTNEPAEESAPPPYVHRGTLRSGQSFRHAGTVVVLGDVNPGAQIVSGGDVLVWGRLRGIVHAGAMGDAQAIVAALDFEPLQLRIASYIAMSPKGASNNPGYWFWKRERSGIFRGRPTRSGAIRPPQPEVARVIDKQIFVDPWDAKG